MSAAEQIQLQVDRSLEPKLEIKYDDCDDKEHIILISNTYQISQRFNI